MHTILRFIASSVLVVSLHSGCAPALAQESSEPSMPKMSLTPSDDWPTSRFNKMLASSASKQTNAILDAAMSPAVRPRITGDRGTYNENSFWISANVSTAANAQFANCIIPEKLTGDFFGKKMEIEEGNANFNFDPSQTDNNKVALDQEMRNRVVLSESGLWMSRAQIGQHITKNLEAAITLKKMPTVSLSLNF